MKKLTDLLEDFTIKSIEEEFHANLKLVEDFGHLVAENSFPKSIQLKEIAYELKYRGNLKNVFLLSIRRIFFAKILIKEQSGQERIFKRKLALKGKYHLKNISNGEVEILTSSPYSKYGNTIRKFSKPEEGSILADVEFNDFLLDDFPMS